jgi:hypothetical protein
MTWFEQLAGCPEQSIEAVHSQLPVDDEHLVASANEKRVDCR